MTEPGRLLLSTAAVLLLAGCNGSGGGGGGGDACRRAVPSASGPGDVSNHFPLSVGARWNYELTETLGSSPDSAQRSRWSVEVTGTRPSDGTTASVFVASRHDGSSPPEEALFAKGPSGVTQLADETLEPPLDRLFPLQVMAFPFTTGSSFEQLSCSGLDLGEDLDGDGKKERFDIRSTVTVVGEEDVNVPAGGFLAVRIDTHLTMTVRATTGQTATVSGVESIWYAPGVGRVRSSSTVGSGASAESSDQVLLGYDVEGRRGGLIRVATLATSLAPANSDTETPGRPALAFDGTGHLLVSRVNPTGGWNQESLRAQVLAGDGTPARQLAIADRQGYGLRPAAAFNGSSHLVVSNLCSADCSTIFAQRVSPAGDLLDGASGFDVTHGGQTVYAPAVASDGGGWLVVWTRYLGGLEAARVSATGAVLGSSPLRGAMTPAPSNPAIAFGGGVYLVSWVEGPSVLAVRVAPDGTVLDDPPLAISTAPGDKGMGGIAFDGTRFLVVWSDARRGDIWINGPAHDVYAARVAPDGTLLDGAAGSGGIVVNALPGVTKAHPVVAFDGGRFVVTWWIDGFYGEVGIFAARVTGDGMLLDGPVSGPGLRIASPVATASRLVHPVAVPAAGGQALLAWVENTELMGTTKEIEGAWYAW